jgi:hypothetical protein
MEILTLDALSLELCAKTVEVHASRTPAIAIIDLIFIFRWMQGE